jgi:hypothetical protein
MKGTTARHRDVLTMQRLQTAGEYLYRYDNVQALRSLRGDLLFRAKRRMNLDGPWAHPSLNQQKIAAARRGRSIFQISLWKGLCPALSRAPSSFLARTPVVLLRVRSDEPSLRTFMRSDDEYVREEAFVFAIEEDDDAEPREFSRAGIPFGNMEVLCPGGGWLPVPDAGVMDDPDVCESGLSFALHRYGGQSKGCVWRWDDQEVVYVRQSCTGGRFLALGDGDAEWAISEIAEIVGIDRPEAFRWIFEIESYTAERRAYECRLSRKGLSLRDRMAGRKPDWHVASQAMRSGRYQDWLGHLNRPSVTAGAFRWSEPFEELAKQHGIPLIHDGYDELSAPA